MQRLRAQSFAKINTYLGVHQTLLESAKHKVDSIMFAVDLADDVSVYLSWEDDVIRDSHGVAFSFDDDAHVDVHMSFVARKEPCPELLQNTVYKAASAVLERLKTRPRVAIELIKHSPSGMGLGASSGNAACVLKLLADELLGDMPQKETFLFEAAAKIGADVPFFLESRPAYFDSAGDHLNECFSRTQAFDVVIVCPDEQNVTKGMYAAFDRDPKEAADILPQLELLRGGCATAAELAYLLHNNLSEAALAENESARQALSWLGAQPGVLAAQVTGSGAASFALCATRESAQNIVSAAKNMNLLAYAQRTLI